MTFTTNIIQVELNTPKCEIDDISVRNDCHLLLTEIRNVWLKQGKSLSIIFLSIYLSIRVNVQAPGFSVIIRDPVCFYLSALPSLECSFSSQRHLQDQSDSWIYSHYVTFNARNTEKMERAKSLIQLYIPLLRSFSED